MHIWSVISAAALLLASCASAGAQRLPGALDDYRESQDVPGVSSDSASPKRIGEALYAVTRD